MLLISSFPNVRLGSQPDLPPLDRDVRFAALNGLKSDIAPCPKSAQQQTPRCANEPSWPS
jgi:hypothetical protein